METNTKQQSYKNFRITQNEVNLRLTNEYSYTWKNDSVIDVILRAKISKCKIFN
jgi:hypothetical protein